jgi:hypothetical protein
MSATLAALARQENEEPSGAADAEAGNVNHSTAVAAIAGRTHREQTARRAPAPEKLP